MEGSNKTEVIAFYDLVSEMTSHHLCRILSTRSESLDPAHIHRRKDYTI